MEDLLNSKDPQISLKADQCPILVEILKKLTQNEEVEKISKFLAKVEALPDDFKIGQLTPLFLPNGQVKEWMMSSVQNGEEIALPVWSSVVKILGKNLHQPGDGTVLLNSLLHVVEKAFKHSTNSIRMSAYNSWMVLMDNFAMNPTVLVTKRRVKLIVRPLLGTISNRTEDQIQLKFDAWWHYFGLLGPALKTQVESVIIPFLQFCFSSTVNDNSSKNNGEPQSPAKKFSSLRKKCLEAAAILCCGLNHVKATCLDISKFVEKGVLLEGVIDSNDFIDHYSTILQCITEVYETLQFQNKLEIEQFSTVIKTIGTWAEKVANDREIKDKGETAIGHFLEMIVNLIIVSAKRDESHVLNLAVLNNVSRIPEDVLASSNIWEFEKGAKKESPALTLIDLMLKQDFLKFVYNSNHEDKFFTLIHKFLRAGSLIRLQDGLNVLDGVFAKVQNFDKDLSKKMRSFVVESHGTGLPRLCRQVQ